MQLHKSEEKLVESRLHTTNKAGVSFSVLMLQLNDVGKVNVVHVVVISQQINSSPLNSFCQFV